MTWKRVFLCALAVLVIAGCGAASGENAAASRARPTAAPTSIPPTAAPTAVNYVALRTRLLAPLGALIIATRENNAAQIAQHLGNFNNEANQILPVIEKDVSTNANRLHSAIVNTREAAARRDITSLEAQRLTLLEIR